MLLELVMSYGLSWCLIFVTGPRFTMIVAKILGGSFGGPTLYINPDYTSPNVVSLTSN